MQTNKTTKRALLGSLTSLLLCFAMLIGSTFAWFTDSASTSVNKIEAGTLRVGLEMWDATAGEGQGGWVDAEGKTLNFIKASGAPANEAVLWEPGATYKLPEIKIVNEGNLALKYKVYVSAASGDMALAEVLKVKMGDREVGTLKDILANAVENSSDPDGYIHGTLAADAATDPITITMTMDTAAGNEYQGKSINGIAVTVVATQDTVEYDSNDNQYDADATFETLNLVTSDELDTALNTEGASVTVVGTNVPLSNVGTNGVTISATSGSTLKTNATKISADNVTIKGATIYGAGASGNTASLRINGNDATIENVNYIGQGSGGDIAISVSTGADNTGTTFKGTKVTNAFRGIQFWKLSGNSVIEDCVLDVAGYTFNVDSVASGATLTAKNSTFNGWTSYTYGIELVSFENCKFGLNTYEYLRPYSNTTLTNCEFTSAGYQLNAGGSAAFAITLTNCTKDGTAITADNVIGLLVDTDGWNHDATLKVNGTVVTVP